MADHSQAIRLHIDGIEQALQLFLHGNKDQIISERLRKEGVWEAYETELSVKLLSAGQTYIDVGANIGYYSVIASRCVGDNGTVISYEPDADNFALLNKNITANQLKNIQSFPYALYDKDGEGKLYLSADNFGDHRIYQSPIDREHQSIRLINGGQHLSTLCDHVDFIKIDTQGAEFFVLNGLMDVVMRNKEHLRMIIEVCPYGIRKSGSHGLELLQLLDSTGMQYHIIDHIGHALIPAESHHLADWIKSLDADLLNEGFINLLVSPKGYDLERYTTIVAA